MRNFRNNFTVEIKNSRLESLKKKRSSIWGGIDLKDLMEKIEDDLPEEKVRIEPAIPVKING